MTVTGIMVSGLSHPKYWWFFKTTQVVVSRNSPKKKTPKRVFSAKKTWTLCFLNLYLSSRYANKNLLRFGRPDPPTHTDQTPFTWGCIRMSLDLPIMLYSVVGWLKHSLFKPHFLGKCSNLTCAYFCKWLHQPQKLVYQSPYRILWYMVYMYIYVYIYLHIYHWFSMGFFM